MGSARATVAILGGDPVTGRSLEALLQAAGYRARSLAEERMDEINEVLADSQLLVVVPSSSSAFRNVLLRALSSLPSAGMPVLELLPVDGEQIFRTQHVLAWPCPPEKLKRAIETALHSRR
ncbi:MAG: hypothetical protein H0U55_15500 [Rubrobacteraceae bacterium]|nr:hypothetical protein [Rubrobacteraceae bacterium]